MLQLELNISRRKNLDEILRKNETNKIKGIEGKKKER